MNSIAMEMPSELHNLPYDEAEEVRARVDEAQIVTLENVGAIERLEFPVSPKGGVVIFKGRNGSGKSTGIDAVSCLLRGSTAGMPTLRDGCQRGKVEGFGASINLSIASRRTSGTPELVVDNIEGKFSISELVNPRSKTNEAADKERLKALITLTGKQADRDTFVSLFSTEDEFRSVVSTASLETTDPVEMARRVKADVDREARKYEEMAQQQQAKLEALKGTYEEFREEDIIPNMEQFQRTQRTVIAHLSELEERHRQNQEKERMIENAKASIDEINVADEEAKIAMAQTDVESADNDERMYADIISDLRQKIETLEKDYIRQRTELLASLSENQIHRDAAAKRRKYSSSLVETLKTNLERLDTYRKTVEELSQIVPVDMEELQKYRKMADMQAKRVERNAIARQLQTKMEHARSVACEAERLREKAWQLRETGRSCDGVLSELIGKESPLKIVDGRMVLQTGRGETFFSELSDGERWKIAFQTIAPYVRKDGEIGLVTIPQTGWESLDPQNQALISELAHQHKICVVTAEATADDLMVEVC